MTNRELIQSMSLRELAGFLCNLFGADDCSYKCPGFDHCRVGHKGLLDWLNMEADNDG